MERLLIKYRSQQKFKGLNPDNSWWLLSGAFMLSEMTLCEEVFVVSRLHLWREALEFFPCLSEDSAFQLHLPTSTVIM